MVAAIIQGFGLDPLSLPLECGSFPSRYLPSSAKVILLAMDREPEGFDPLDLAMALRGLGKLHPSRIVVNGAVNRKSDSLTMLEGVREHLRDEGIRLIEGTPASSEILWRPVPLCTYAPPSPWHLESTLPRIPGRSAAEGKASFLPTPDEKASASLPLLAVTDSGEVAGSIWWEAMMPEKPTGPYWLLGGRLLLFPNHSPLPVSSGGIPAFSTSTVTMVQLDLFLLRIEEKERGTFSPDFEALWDHATVVIGSPKDTTLVGSLDSILKTIAFRRLPLLSQALLTFLLVAMLFSMRGLSRQTRLWIALTLLLVTLGAGAAALSRGLHLPLIPPLIAVLLILLSSLPGFRRMEIAR